MYTKSISFNNQRNSNIKLVQGRAKAPFSPLDRDIVRYPGGFRLTKTERGLLEIEQPFIYEVKNDIPREFIIQGENDRIALDIRDSLTDWLITDDWSPLQFDDEPGRTYIAVVQNTIDDFERFGDLRSGTIQFVAKEVIGETYELNILQEYRTFTISGQTETPWTSKTIFEEASDQFTLETNQGSKIILDYNFIAGDVLEIDYFKRKVTLNGKNLAVAVSLSTVWKKIKPGAIDIKASRETTLTYSERYY